MKRNLLFAVLAITGLFGGMSSCQKAPELTLTSSSNIEFSADGSLGSITFTANRDWTVRAYDSWVSVSPSSGTASDGPVTVSLRCNANTTYEDRSTTVTINMGDLSQTVTVKQPANKGIVLPKQVFDLQSDTRSIDVEVQANVQYSVSSSVDWIRQTGTKALTSKTLTFSIQENKTYDFREGKITIKPNEGNVQEQVITVRQAQKDALIVEKTSYDMPYGGGEIEIKVEANVAFTVTPNVDWLHYIQTKALTNSTVCIKVDENTTYSNREGKIEIAQQNGSLKHTITVKQAGRIAVTSIELNKTSLTLKEGESETLSATVKPDNATDKTVTWTSSNAGVASVDAAGNVSAIKEGTAIITAQAGEKTAKCEISVYKDIPVSSIELDKSSLSLVVGDEATLKATVKPADATDKTVTWSSSNATIVSVDSYGKVTAIKDGSATVFATAGGITASCAITIQSASDGAVDLGIVMTREDGSTYKLYWRDRNLGAENIEDIGLNYAWGEIEPKSEYTYENYKWYVFPYNDDRFRITKYCEDAASWGGTGEPDGKSVLDMEDDAAHVLLGGKWRMPTVEEQDALRSQCTWTWTSRNGIKGYEVKSNANSNSIFLPETTPNFRGAYWSSTLNISTNSYVLLFDSENVLKVNGERCYSCYIRPVAE